MLRATDCPVLEVKAKINVSVPSDVIIDYRSIRIVVHSEDRTRFDDVTKIAFKYLDFLGIYTNVVFSVEPRKSGR